MPMKSDSSGRIAGALYVVVIATGMFSLAYVPSQLQLTGDAWDGRSQHHFTRSNVSARHRVLAY